jgi:hypothetical protein
VDCFAVARDDARNGVDPRKTALIFFADLRLNDGAAAKCDEGMALGSAIADRAALANRGPKPHAAEMD